MEEQKNENTYITGVWIAGIICFLATWIYACSTWGFLIGLMFGWIPALIAGIIGGFLWPILMLLIIIMIFLANQ